MTEDVEGRPPQQKRTFKYPLLPRPIEVFCWVLMLLTFCIAYGAEMSVRGWWVLAPVGASWVFMGWPRMWRCLLAFGLRSDHVTLDANGITVGRRSVAWEDITQIGHPRLLGRRSVVRMKFRAPKVGFFDLRVPFTRPGRPLELLGYPFVYRNMMPSILSARPDLDVPPLIRRLMDDPDRAMEPRVWLVFAALGATAALFAATWGIYGRSIYSALAPAHLFCVPPLLGIIAIPWTKDARTAFVAVALCSPFLVAPARLLSLLGAGSYAGFQAVTATSLAMLLVAAVVFFLMDRLRARHQVRLGVLLLVVPLAVYGGIRSSQWAPTAVSWQDASDGYAWGADSVHLASWTWEGPPGVLQLANMEEVSIPVHGAVGLVYWLDKQHLLYPVQGAHEDELWAFGLQQGTEFMLPTAGNWSVSHRHPVDPDSRRVAWLESSADGQAATLHIWDLAKRRQERPPIPMPAGVEDRHVLADWAGADEVALDWQDDDGRLHVLRVDVRTEETETAVSADGYDRWIPIGDFSYAFGVREGSWDTCCLSWVELKTGRTVELDGIGSYPGVAADAGCSFRVRRLGERRVLSRFEFATEQETTVWQVPSHMDLAGISRSGHTVLLQPGWDSMAEFMVLDVPSGQRHTIRLAGVGLPSASRWLAFMPRRAPLSPDGRRILLGTFNILSESGEVLADGSQKALLYTVPPDWP